MLRFLLTSAFAATLALPAFAQTETEYEAYRPLHVGNEWVYEGEYYYSADGSVTERQWYFVVRIASETTLSGEPSRIAECIEMDETGTQVLSVAEMNVPVGYGQPVTVSGDPGGCGELFSPIIGSSSGNEADIEIGGISYAVGSISGYSNQGGPGSGGSGGTSRAIFAESIGLVSYRSTSYRAFPPSYSSSTEYTLAYAAIDGDVYGTSSVATEEAAPGVVASRLRAYPSPAATAVTIESGDQADVEIFDLLGRRMAQVETASGQPIRLDVSAWPTGLYVARVLTADGPQTARFVVAR